MKPLFYLLISLLTLLMATAAFAAAVLQGIGIDEDGKKARSYALEDLASSLLVEVNSQITICQQVKANTAEDCGSKSAIQTKTRLPLLGVKYAHKRIKRNEYRVVATLDPATALTSFTLRVKKSAYEGYRANALAADFDQLLHQNLAIGNQFKSEIVTDNGSQDLFFNSGNEVRLMVRLNQTGYFYVVGHVPQKDAEFSYLIELNDTKGPGKFIKFIPADYANRYLELGQFAVEAPFGVEHLQVIASNHNLDDRLPAYDYDDKTGYYVINGSLQNSKSAVLKTRGLKLKKSMHQQQPLFHESVLTFTTTP